MTNKEKLNYIRKLASDYYEYGAALTNTRSTAWVSWRPFWISSCRSVTYRKRPR